MEQIPDKLNGVKILLTFIAMQFFTPIEIVKEIFGLKGRMEVEVFTPTAENPVWSLRRWQDFRDPASAKRTWTEARALFSR